MDKTPEMTNHPFTDEFIIENPNISMVLRVDLER
jgi:hypothetical protein